MVWFDLAVLFASAYLLVLFAGVITHWAERLSLAVFAFFLLKGFEMFVLVAVGETGATAQSIASVLALGVAWVACLGRLRVSFDEGDEGGAVASGGFKLKFALALGTLFLLSLGAALWFPVGAPDGLWYEIRAFEFLNGSGLGGRDVAPHFRQYPPLVPLLFAWLDSAGWPLHKALFPVSGLALCVILYCRLRHQGKSEHLAGWLTLALASTPYFWWHSQLGLLNLMGGACFAAGIFYWHEFAERWMRNSGGAPACLAWLGLSGTLLGMACLIRPEFVLFSGIVLLLLMVVLHHHPHPERGEAQNLLPVFAGLTLGPATLWAAVLLMVVPDVSLFGAGMIAVILLLWLMSLVWGLGWFRASPLGVGGLLLAGAGLFFALLINGKAESVSPGSALVIGAYQTFGFHLFFGFTFLLWALAFTARWKQLEVPQRYLLAFLAAFLLVQFGTYALLPRESEASARFFNSILLSPGNAVNSPATRGYLAWYPVLLLWLGGLAKTRKAFRHE